MVNEIPLSPEPQAFRIVLADKTYGLLLRWNIESHNWVLDISDADGAPLVLGIPIVTGTDLLGQYKHLGIGGSLVAQTDHNPYVVPTFTSLGVTGRLYFVGA
jgi:hypothetical protein